MDERMSGGVGLGTPRAGRPLARGVFLATLVGIVLTQKDALDRAGMVATEPGPESAAPAEA